VPDDVQGLWYIAAAIAYGVAVLLADRYFGLTGAAIAVAACLVIQFSIIEPAERRRRRRARTTPQAPDWSTDISVEGRCGEDEGRRSQMTGLR